MARFWIVQLGIEALMLLAFFGQVIGQSENDERCAHDLESRPYELLSKVRSGKLTKGDKTDDDFLVFVLVKPKDINREHLVSVGKHLKAVFCNEVRILVVFFDSNENARKYTDNRRGITANPVLERGYYSFDSVTRRELLEFSLKPGNPTTEVEIDLSDSDCE